MKIDKILNILKEKNYIVDYYFFGSSVVSSTYNDIDVMIIHDIDDILSFKTWLKNFIEDNNIKNIHLNYLSVDELSILKKNKKYSKFTKEYYENR